MAASHPHRLAQRDKVMLAARKCFIRHGFHATGMAEIAAACRMSAGNIYHYFPNKNAIVRAITDETRSRMVPALRPLAEHADPVEGLVEMMLFCVRWLGGDANARLWMEISPVLSGHGDELFMEHHAADVRAPGMGAGDGEQTHPVVLQGQSVAEKTMWGVWCAPFRAHL